MFAFFSQFFACSNPRVDRCLDPLLWDALSSPSRIAVSRGVTRACRDASAKRCDARGWIARVRWDSRSDPSGERRSAKGFLEDPESLYGDWTYFWGFQPVTFTAEHSAETAHQTVRWIPRMGGAGSRVAGGPAGQPASWMARLPFFYFYMYSFVCIEYVCIYVYVYICISLSLYIYVYMILSLSLYIYIYTHTLIIYNTYR